MLQRSPTYIVARPAEDGVARWLSERLPPLLSHALARWKNVFLTTLFYNFSRKYPERAKRLLLHWVRLWLGSDEGIAEHFTPRYAPWDQRVCLVPDGDLFMALRSGKAEIVTDHIERFTETGIMLRSGRELPADLIVTATGLRLRFLGGVTLSVDGAEREPRDLMIYKGMMLSDVPNMALAMGYTNASWTLKCDLTSQYVCRLLNHMDANGYASCCPRMNDPSIRPVPVLDFSSGYVQRSIAEFPQQGSAAPFRLYQNYALDVLALRHSAVEDGTLMFS
jgi:cation diffusion facilitator CzcD-associated flavoprotein CzcO